MKNTITIVALLLAALALTGCVHNKWRADEAKAFTADQARAIAAQKPILSIETMDGQTIEFKGVKKLEVYAPSNATVRALPQQRSGVWGFGEKLIDGGLKYFGYKFGSETLGRIFDSALANAGDHSNTRIDIRDSMNDQSDHSQHGDTIVDSHVIAGPVTGDGAGIGNTTGDGSAFGEENVVINNDNEGEVRIESPGPITEDNSDNSDPGDDCTGSDCSEDTETTETEDEGIGP